MFIVSVFTWFAGERKDTRMATTDVPFILFIPLYPNFCCEFMFLKRLGSRHTRTIHIDGVKSNLPDGPADKDLHRGRFATKISGMKSGI